MSVEAPRLSASDIQLELERIFARERRSNLAALHGAGESGLIDVKGRKWEVVPTRSEMELRSLMPLPGTKLEQPRVFLVDWTEDQLPLDLRCRLAAGRMFQISRGTRLASLFGARQAEPSLTGTGLATVLLSGDVGNIKRVSGVMLTRREAYRRFLEAWVGLPLEGELDLARLALWCLRHANGASLGTRAEKSEPWRRLREELRSFLAEETGAFGGACWRAWEQGLGRRFIQVAVLLEAHARRRDPVAEGVLQGRLGELAPGFGSELLSRLDAIQEAEWLDSAISALPATERHALLREADLLIPLESFATTRCSSGWLPAGHAAREDALADALSRLVARQDRESLRIVRDRVDAVIAHRLDAVLRTEGQVETRAMGTRLAAYLVKRAVAPPPSEVGLAYEAALELARAHVAEGGFVDWCRGRLRAPLPFGPQLTSALHQVLKAADELRRRDDQRFAKALLAWHEAGRPASEVTPIDAVTRQFVGELLEGAPNRRVLIILLDGMSWAVAVQLLARLEAEKWMPLAWRPKGHATRGHFPPVLAELPTLTRVSRAAFFSGRRDGRAGDKGTAEDANRWRANRFLIRSNDEAVLPDLVLKDQLMDGETLRREIQEAIKSDARVVGVVVNSIDEDLKGSTQTMRDYSRGDVIKPLTGLLTAAAGEERIVLLASDHGHVLGDGMTPRATAAARPEWGGKRWRVLEPGADVQPYEVELPADAWRPRGTERIAAIWDEQASHGIPSYGEHGGLSLAEVVAPTILIAPEWLAQVQGEDGAALETRPFPTPAWWDLDVGVAPTRTTIRPEPQVGTQVPLLPDPRAIVTPAETDQAPAVRAGLVGQLEKSKVFKAQVEGQRAEDVERVLQWLSVLLDAGDALPEREFARLTQTRAHAVAGAVARMGMLNCDGYAMVEHDRAAAQVLVHRSRLIQQYGLKP